MRAWWALVLSISLGCASTVTRLDGEFPTQTGPARTACEKKDWLVVAPTRAQLFDNRGRRTEVRDDGVGLYQVGSNRPESIPALADALAPESGTFARHGSVVRAHDTKQVVAGALGAAGLIAIGVGTFLFVNAFSTERQGINDEQSVNSTQAAVGGVLVGMGFGMGIGGIAVNPGQAERSRAEAARHVFLPPEDDRGEIVEAVGAYNRRVRERCAGSPD